MKDICLENYYRDNGKEYSGSYGKESACNAGDPGSVPGLGRSPGEGNGYHSSILVWRIPWTEDPHNLQAHRVTKVRHDGATNIFILYTFEK